MRLFNNNPKVYLFNLQPKYKCTLIEFSFDNGRFFDPQEYKGITHLLEHCLYHTLEDCYDSSFEVNARTYDNELNLFVKMPRGKRLISFMATAISAIANFNPSQALIEREKQEVAAEVGKMTFIQQSLDKVYQYCLGKDTVYDSGHYIGANFNNITKDVLLNFWEQYKLSTNLIILIGLPKWSIYVWRFKYLKKVFTNSIWLTSKQHSLPIFRYINKGIVIENTENDTVFGAIVFPGVPLNAPFIDKLTIYSMSKVITKRCGKGIHFDFNGIQNPLCCIYFTASPDTFLSIYVTIQNIIKRFKEGTELSFVELDDCNYDDAYEYADKRNTSEDTFRLVHNYLDNWQPTLNLKFLKHQIYARTPEYFKNIALKYFVKEKANVIILKPANFQLNKDQVKLDF